MTDKLTLTEAAYLAECGERTLTRAITLGELAASKVRGRITIDRSEIARWMDGRSLEARASKNKVEGQ